MLQLPVPSFHLLSWTSRVFSEILRNKLEKSNQSVPEGTAVIAKYAAINAM